MSKSEILAELPRLKVEERREILEQLWQLEEHSVLQGPGSDAAEKTLLDRELAAFEQDGQRGSPWREVLQRVRSSSPR